MRGHEVSSSRSYHLITVEVVPIGFGGCEYDINTCGFVARGSNAVFQAAIQLDEVQRKQIMNVYTFLLCGD